MLPNTHTYNVHDEVICYEAAQPNLNFTKPPNLKTADISDYAVYTNSDQLLSQKKKKHGKSNSTKWCFHSAHNIQHTILQFVQCINVCFQVSMTLDLNLSYPKTKATIF